MERQYLNSKIHKATVTNSNIDYEGSCEIDIALMKAANIDPYEKIDIYDITNGERLSTYAIPGKPDTGIIGINGACCHKIKINDEIIICTYTMLNENERANHVPTIIYVNESNQIIDKPLNQKLNAI
jgi:aspartate 1-decarboxylase|tara:strand:- start:1010 stop:1390 length:381 start_codon:yes stop_codon:yes gene_type:complete